MSGLYFHDVSLWIYNFSKVDETLDVNLAVSNDRMSGISNAREEGEQSVGYSI